LDFVILLLFAQGVSLGLQKFFGLPSARGFYFYEIFEWLLTHEMQFFVLVVD